MGAEEIEKAVGVGSVAFGAVAALTPRVFLGMYGLPDEANMRAMTRLWGTRTAVLGALVFTLEGAENKRTLMTMAAAMNAADALVVASAGGVSARARVLGSLTSAGFAGALAYMLSQSPGLGEWHRWRSEDRIERFRGTETHAQAGMT